MLLTVALFLAMNIIAYNHPLGIYSIPLGLKSIPMLGEELKNSGSGGSQSFWGFERIARVLIVFVKLNGHLLLYFPITIFQIYYILISFWFKKIKLKRLVFFLLLVGVANSFAVPLLGWEGGKEWGARYLLILIPLIALTATISLNALMKIPNYKLLNFCRIFFVASLVYGTYVNTYLGTVHLSQDYYEIAK
jgi:hypothetical protein